MLELELGKLALPSQLQFEPAGVGVALYTKLRRNFLQTEAGKMTNSASNPTSRKHGQPRRLIPAATIRKEASSGARARSAAASELPAGQPEAPPPEVWASLEELFWDHLEEVQNKWNTLKVNDDIWAKLIYFEQNRRLAKAYVSAPVLNIDGSTNGLDGFRIGLSGIENNYRSLESMACLRSIGQGIKLKIDNQGNILLRKVTTNSAINKCVVRVKDFPLQSSMDDDGGCFVHELDHSPDSPSYKLFDARSFRLQLEREKPKDESFVDWRQCVSIISFARQTTCNNLANGNILSPNSGNNNNNNNKQAQTKKDTNNSNDLLQDPCWLMIINIIAIDMLKSSICDRNLFVKQELSSLLNNHANQNSLLANKKIHPDRDNEPSRPSRPIRANSSASILFPSSSTSSSSYSQPEEQVVEKAASGCNNSSVARTKKLRMAGNGSNNSSSPVKGGNNKRFGGSSRHLATTGANNTIYTTFNSKYLANRETKRSSAPADGQDADEDHYNEPDLRSRCSSRQALVAKLRNERPLRRSQERLIEIPVNQQTFMGSNKQSKASSCFNNLETNKNEKGLSLSSFDLNKQKFDFKPIQWSAFKMNYDDPRANQNQLDESSQQQKYYPSSEQNQFPGSRSAIVNSLNNRSNKQASCNDGSPERLLESSLDIVNHNECSAMQGKSLLELEGRESQGKLFESSTASSSSSSGCVDNDYFMSQSSSSMSSSMASNERELFSQPTSSSGIVCSGNTSDEYDDSGRKLVNQPTTVRQESNCVSYQVTTAKSDAKLRQKGKQLNSRGYRIKSVEPPGFCCEQRKREELPETEQQCDCPLVEYDCDCCPDCITEAQEISDENCDCIKTAESIYGQLPHPASFPAAKSNPRKAGRGGSNLMTSSYNERLDAICPLPLSDEGCQTNGTNNKQQSTKDNKHSWLYSKLLPKFIFASSASTRQLESSKGDRGTQRKSNTLDRAGKFRLTRSTQDLS